MLVHGVIDGIRGERNRGTLKEKVPGDEQAAVARALVHYDAATAATLIEVPALPGIGFLDAVCPPTAVYAAYNNLAGRKKAANYIRRGGHRYRSPPGWGDQLMVWIQDGLGAAGISEK